MSPWRWFNQYLLEHIPPKLEYDKLLRFGYSLSLKALFPSNIERQNVKLALKVFNSYVVEALRHFGAAIEGSSATADFIEIIIKWWKIVNVKTPLKGKRLNDVFQEPIVASHENDTKIHYLNNFLNWLEVWNGNKHSQKLTPQTHNALYHTTYGLLEIAQYCFEELKLSYILFGKFQTDCLEDRFGKYRQLAGGQYNISIRQVYEVEKKLRVQSLLSLKSQTGQINITCFADDADKVTPELDSDSENQQFCPVIVIDETDEYNVREDMAVITYLAGYCCYIALKRVRCDTCKDKLVLNEELIIEDNYCLIKKLSRGKLLYPHENVVKVVLFCYIYFNKVLEKYEEEFLLVYNKRNVLTHLIITCLKEVEFYAYFGSCEIHQQDTTLKIIIRSTVNTLLKNYCGKTNDTLKKSSKNKKLSTLQ